MGELTAVASAKRALRGDANEGALLMYCGSFAIGGGTSMAKVAFFFVLTGALIVGTLSAMAR